MADLTKDEVIYCYKFGLEGLFNTACEAISRPLKEQGKSDEEILAELKKYKLDEIWGDIQDALKELEE